MRSCSFLFFYNRSEPDSDRLRNAALATGTGTSCTGNNSNTYGTCWSPPPPSCPPGPSASPGQPTVPPPSDRRAARSPRTRSWSSSVAGGGGAGRCRRDVAADHGIDCACVASVWSASLRSVPLRSCCSDCALVPWFLARCFCKINLFYEMTLGPEKDKSFLLAISLPRKFVS